MSWAPIDGSFLQYSKDASGTSASGYYLKCYAAGTNTPISISLDNAGGTLVDKVQLDSLGFVQNASGGSTILYIDQSYRLVLYVNATDADNNTFANAVQDEDNIPQGDGLLRSELAASTGTELIGHTQFGRTFILDDFLQDMQVVTPEHFGADPTGVTDSTSEVQAAMDYARSNNLYLRGMGKYLISSTITVPGGRFGFEFGPSVDIFAASQYGLVWGGGNGVDTNEDTVTPMLLITDASYLTCGPINLNNRANLNTGIGGIKFKATGSAQYGFNKFERVLCAGMDYGLIIGTSTVSGDNDDVMEQSLVEYFEAFQVKNPLLLNGTNNDKIRFQKINIIGYQAGAEYNNGASDYAIKMDQLSNGAVFDDIVIAQHTNVVTDTDIIDIVEGTPKFGSVSVEGGAATARALRLRNTAGASRSPIDIESFYATDIRDSSGVAAILDARLGQRVGTLTVQGDIQCDSLTWGSVFFRGSSGYILTGDAANHNVEVYRDDDADTNIDGTVTGNKKAERFQANGTGFLQTGNTKQGTATASSSLLSSGVAYTWATVTLPSTTGKRGVAIWLEYMVFRGNAAANAVQSGTAMYVINRVDGGTIAATAVDGSEEAFAGAATITNCTSTASVNVSGDDVQIRLTQTTTPANSMRCIFNYRMCGSSDNSTNDYDITINAS